MMKFFQKSDEKIFVFNHKRQIISMNEAAKQIVTDEIFSRLVQGDPKAICLVCRGYTTAEELKTCRECYVLEGDEDISSFQVYLETKGKGVRPYSASFQTIDKQNGIRLLI